MAAHAGPELRSTLSSALANLEAAGSSASNGQSNSGGPVQAAAASPEQTASGALSAYILMQRIQPPPQRCALVSGHRVGFALCACFRLVFSSKFNLFTPIKSRFVVLWANLWANQLWLRLMKKDHARQ